MGKKQKKRKSQKTGVPPPQKLKGPGFHAIRQLTQGWTGDGLFRELRKIDHAEAEKKAKHSSESDASS